jgi:hypothetical protein
MAPDQFLDRLGPNVLQQALLRQHQRADTVDTHLAVMVSPSRTDQMPENPTQVVSQHNSSTPDKSMSAVSSPVLYESSSDAFLTDLFEYSPGPWLDDNFLDLQHPGASPNIGKGTEYSMFKPRTLPGHHDLELTSQHSSLPPFDTADAGMHRSPVKRYSLSTPASVIDET